jgi:hypothetical protein
MTEQGTTAEATGQPQLEYAAQPAVGDVVMTRSGGVTIVVRRPNAWRIAGTLWPIVLALVAIGAVTLNPSGRAVSVPNVVFCVVAILGASVGTVPGLVYACHPVRWEVSPTGITVTARRVAHVVHHRYARFDIADVRVERVQVQNHLFKRTAVVTVTPYGARRVHCYGRRAELDFVAQAFRDGLGLGSDPLGESGFPVPPRWSRTTRLIGLGRVAP